MGAARDLYITDTGEYTADIYGSNKHFLGSKTHTISTVDTVPGFTAAFHHGAFSASDYSSAYSSVSAAATAGFVYSDTPAGTYSWGTLAAQVKERENPDFTANSTLHTDYTSKYGWSSNSGWEVSSKDEFSSSYEVWNAFNKRTYANNNWLSGSAPSTSSPQWLKIKYPSQQVIKSYVIRARENTSPRFPTAWKLQGANTDIGDTDTGWTDIGSEQTQTVWGQGRSKSFDLSTNTTAYQYYRLRITGSKESASSSNSDYVAIGQWFLNTVNDENTTNHEQYTRYTWTPAASLTADVFMVAGGGGGGSHHGGGGGGGGVVYNTNQILSGQKSIVIGNGGEGGYGTGTTEHRYGLNGKNTYFSGLNAAIGGGGGSGQGNITSGGSGGSGGGSFASTVGGSPTTGQGYKGGDNVGNDGAAGGGGAGGAGSNNNGRSGGNGGLGINYTSTFGTTYGDSGWFASGGGGGSSTNGGAGSASQGGGTNGSNTSSFVTDADSHTGGGGGGSGYNGGNTSQIGGDGGSGIVIIKKVGATNPPALNFDGYNKLSIDNVDLRGYVESPTDNDKLPRASAAEREIAAGNWTPHYDYIYEAQSSPTGFYRFKICNQSASTPSNPTSDTSNTHTNNRHSILYEISTGKWYDGSPNADPNYITTTSTYAAESVTTANPAQIWTWNGTTLNDSYVLSSLSWSQPPPDGSSTFTIKKDGAAFATTTSNTVYIRDTGTYTAEVKGLGAYVTEVSKVVSGDITEFPNYVNATSFYYGGGVVDNTGKLYTWGHNGYGDSGRGASDRVPTHVSSISDPVSNVWRGTPGYTMAAKTSTDKWYMWGRNTYSGVLGNTTNTGNVTAPEDVTAKVTTYFGDQTVSANKIIKMAMGEHHAAALTAGGKVWSWGGDNTYYATGTGTNDNTVLVTPVQLNRSPPTSGGQYNGYKYKFYMDRYSSSSFTHMKEDWDHNSTFSLSDSLANFQITNASNGSFKYSPWLTDSAYETRDLDTITFDSNGEWTAFKGYGSYHIYIKIIRTVDTSGYLITNTNSAVSTLKIRANGSIFTFNSQTCWYYDRLAGSNNTWYTQQLGYVPSTNTFIEASISGNPDQVYHNKTSSNVTKGSITVPPEGILLSNDPSSWNGGALFANPFTSTSDSLMTGITEIQSTYHGVAALDSSGNVWFWGGSNTSMQYAYPTKLLDSSSISGIVGLRATNKGTLYAWKSDGTFYTRGFGGYGVLANGADSDQYTSWQNVTTLQGKTIKRVFGGNETMFAWTDDGVYGVGRGNNYRLANGSTSNRNIWHKSNTLSALSIKEIDFGHATGLVLTTDGRGYMWGEDASNSMANALSGHQSGAAEATSISALSLVHIPSPSITYDGKNKLTVGGTNYADTSTVTYYSNTYNLGTAKTMYVKDVGEYVFKISGTDKYADSNVHVSSVDLAGATTKPISFDGYNKLTLISPGTNAVSNVTLGATKYDMGSASTFYIKDTGTYDLEMSGSNVFALSSNVVNTISEPAVSGTHRFLLDSGTLTDSNNGSLAFDSGATFEAPELRKDAKTSYKLSVGQNKNVTLPSAMANWCVSMWVFIPYTTSYASSNSSNIPSDFSSHTSGGYSWTAIWTWHMANGREFRHQTHYDSHIYEYSGTSATSAESINMYHSWDSSIGSGSKQNWHPGNNGNNIFMPEAWHHMAWEYNGTTGKFKWYCDGIERTTAESNNDNGV